MRARRTSATRDGRHSHPPPHPVTAKVRLDDANYSWLFVVSAALFVSGIGVHHRRRARRPALHAARRRRRSATDAGRERQADHERHRRRPRPPSSTASVATIVTAKGIEENAPQNDAEWAQVADSAAALAESGNLLLMGDRAVDNGDWVKIRDGADRGGDDGVEGGGGEERRRRCSRPEEAINETCDNCHAKYQRQ